MARYWLRFGDREVALPDGELLVGRGDGCHVRLISPSVSRHHLRVLTVGDAVMAYDLDSRNGTWINEIQLKKPQRLVDGDLVKVGSLEFVVRETSLSLDLDHEQDTSELEIDDPTTSSTTSGHRSTIDLQDDLLLNSASKRGSGGDLDESSIFSVGKQVCSSCGRRFELGLQSCPFCETETYSAPEYITCPGCLALLSRQEPECPKCGLRRTSTSAGIPSAAGGDRRREGRRTTLIHSLYVSSSLTFEAEVTNISRGGLFLVAALLDPVGTQADIVLSTAQRGRVRFLGEVAHVVDEPRSSMGLQPGMGIRFRDIAPAAQKWIEGFLAEHEG